MTYPIKKLGEVCEVVGGGTPSTSNSRYWGNDLFWVTPKNLGQIKDIEISKTDRKISKEGLKKSSAKLLPVGSVILSSRAPIGYVVINTVEMATNQGCRSFICGRNIYNRYLYYFLKNSTDLMYSLAGGSTFAEIAGSKLKEIEISLPPLPEQKKIVKKIEELFVKIDEAQKLREEAQKDAAALIPASLHQIFEKGRKEGWKMVDLKTVSETIKTVSPSDMYKNDFNYIDITSINNKTKKITPKKISVRGAPSRARKPVKKWDTIFATTRPYLKNIAFIPEVYDRSIASTGFCVIRPILKYSDPKYINHIVSSDQFIDRVVVLQKGATYPAVSDSIIYSQKIILPPLPEQKKIVAYLDSLSEKAKKLQELQKQTAEDMKALKQSILHKAFEGELV